MKTLIKLSFAVGQNMHTTAQMIEESIMTIMTIMFLGLSVAYTYQLLTSKNKKL